MDCWRRVFSVALILVVHFIATVPLLLQPLFPLLLFTIQLLPLRKCILCVSTERKLGNKRKKKNFGHDKWGLRVLRNVERLEATPCLSPVTIPIYRRKSVYVTGLPVFHMLSDMQLARLNSILAVLGNQFKLYSIFI